MFGSTYFGQSYFGQGYPTNSNIVFRVFRGLTTAISGFFRSTRRLA